MSFTVKRFLADLDESKVDQQKAANIGGFDHVDKKKLSCGLYPAVRLL